MAGDLTVTSAQPGEMRPPSSSSSRTTTPIPVRIVPCPARLRCLYPPANYGAVEKGTIYRSAFPGDENIGFLESLKIRTVLCLVDSEPSDRLERWRCSLNISRIKISLGKNKDGKIGTTVDSLCEALLYVLNKENWPLHLHCNQGKHRTGCVVACLRKIQGWDMEEILDEYRTYAGAKARDGDIELIKSFEPEAVYEYAKRCGYFPDLLEEFEVFGQTVDPMVKDVRKLVIALGLGTPRHNMDRGRRPVCLTPLPKEGEK